jgi:hypothetical protein
MKSKFFTLAMAALLALSVQSCGKYEEGPGLSLRSKKARVAGTWKQSKLIYNGQDIPLDADDKDDEMILDKDGGVEMVDPGNSTEKGTWSFGSDKETIKFVYGSGSSTSTTEFTIIRLANKEMILELSDSGDKIRVEYTQ